MRYSDAGNIQRVGVRWIRAAFFAAMIAIFSVAAATVSAHEEHGTTFNAPGATIYYEVFGSGNGTPLFVANGGPGFDHFYMHVSDAWDTLGQNRNVVMWDQARNGEIGAAEGRANVHAGRSNQ